jgi:hypothetical protein
MALGDITTIEGDLVAIELLASATATNSPPAAATAGLSMDEAKAAFGGIIPDDISLVVMSTAGSATMSITLKLWGEFGTLGSIASGAWAPLGIGGDTTKGIINGGSAIGETASDVIRHAEPISWPAHCQRLYLEITAIGGTSTAVTAWLVARKRYGQY